MHYHAIEDETGDIVDNIPLCSDSCHRQWCRRNDEEYTGWSGCYETDYTRFCENCGVVLPGFDACSHQKSNVVVNRILSEDGEKCECDRWIQVPARMVGA